MSDQGMNDQDMIAAFIRRNGVTKVAIGERVIQGKLDTRNRPVDNRHMWTRPTSDTSDSSQFRYGYCEDAPCCGCCDPRIGMKQGKIR